MSNNGQEPKTLADLERQLAEAHGKFLEASASGEFTAACRKLKEASERLSQAEAATGAAQQSYERLNQSGAPADLVERAARAARGLPTLDDLRLVIFPGTRKQPSGELAGAMSALEEAEAKERQARNEFHVALDRFTDQGSRLRKLAVGVLAIQRQIEQARAGRLPVDGEDGLEELAIAWLVKLPVVEGLEEYLIPT
jgi:hypothetical protein